MKKLTWLILFLFLVIPVFSTTYYVKNNGDDSKSGASNGQAWKTIAKVNASSFNAGDIILFKKGDEWRETLTIPSSGSSGSQITFGAYGTGVDPIINGSDLVSTWTAATISETWGGISSENDAPGDYGFRPGIAASTMTIDGNLVRIQLLAHSTDDISVAATYIGEKASSGDAFDMESGTITQITWDTGSGTTTVSAGTPKWSDWVAYTFDKTKDYIISIGVTDYYKRGTSVGMSSYYKAGASGEAGTANVTGYTAKAGYPYMLADFSVRTYYPNVWQATLVAGPSLVWLDETLGTGEAAIADLNAANEWYHDPTPDLLYVYSTSDPDIAYTSPGIEASARAYNVNVNAKEYLTFQNLQFLKGNTYLFRSDAGDNTSHDIILDSCTIGKCRWGIMMLTGGTGGYEDCEVNDCTISDIGGSGSFAGLDWRDVDGFTASGNTVHSNHGCGILVTRGDNTVIESNTVYSNGAKTGYESGIKIDSGNGHTIRYNLCYSNIGSGIHIFSDSSVLNLNVYYNIMDGNLTGGVAGNDAGEIELYKNITNVNIYNNVLYGDGSNTPCGIHVQDMASISGWVFKNNIIRNVVTSNIATDASASYTGDHNCFDESAAFTQDGGSTTRTFAQWKSDTSQEANSLNEDPVFITPPVKMRGYWLT